MFPRNISVTNALIILCVVVFIIGMTMQTPALLGIPYPYSPAETTPLTEVRFSYSWFTCFQEGQLWRLITYQFCHANVGHLLFNMWALFFFGPAVEHVFGPKKFLLFYLICGIAGALCSSLLAGMDWYSSLPPYAQGTCTALAEYTGYAGAVHPWQMVPLIGASASIYGVMVATAFLYPDVLVSLVFPPITLKLRTFALGVIGIAVVTILFNLSNAGGEAGHLGGIIMAALIMTVRRCMR